MIPKKSISPLADDVLIAFAKEMIETGKLDALSAKQLEKVIDDYRTASQDKLDSFLKRLTPELRYTIKHAYNKFISGGFVKTNPGVSAYRLNDLRPRFRRELDDAITNSLALIKTQNEQTMLLLEKKFRTWATVPAKDLRGSLTNKAEMLKGFKENVTGDKETQAAAWKHLDFVIRDQSHKMTAAMDRITGDELGAIGFIWHNRRDQRVVGTPGGLYPVAKNPEVHGNHYEREGKFYLLRDNWASKNGYIKGGVYADTLKDGEPGIPIGCRCVRENIFALDDIPDKYKSIITASGKEYSLEHE